MLKDSTSSILFSSPSPCLVTTLSALFYYSISIYDYLYYALGILSFSSGHMNFFSCRNLLISSDLSTIYRELEKKS